MRFISATNRDLPSEVAAGAFRRDLYFRLDGVTMVIPPLRERRGLIGPLALQFLAAARGAPRPAPRLATEVLAALESHDWQGNVRELKAVIERAVVLARGEPIGVRHLTSARGRLGEPARPRATTAPPVAPPARPAPPDPDPSAAAPETLDEEQRADRDRILRALDECAGNQTRAAKQLGMSRTAFVTRLRIYRIPRPRA